jgi:hypothetical protein
LPLQNPLIAYALAALPERVSGQHANPELQILLGRPNCGDDHETVKIKRTFEDINDEGPP